jgi:hypothetical protein
MSCKLLHMMRDQCATMVPSVFCHDREGPSHIRSLSLTKSRLPLKNYLLRNDKYLNSQTAENIFSNNLQQPKALYVHRRSPSNSNDLSQGVFSGVIPSSLCPVYDATTTVIKIARLHQKAATTCLVPIDIDKPSPFILLYLNQMSSLTILG